MKYFNLSKLIFFIKRDTKDSYAWFEVIAVIEFKGRLSRSGLSEGHYTCDVKESTYGEWFRTNDNCIPIPIQSQDVSKSGYVVLYKRVN